MAASNTLQVDPGICVRSVRGDVGSVQLAPPTILCLVEGRPAPNATAVLGQALVSLCGLDGDVSCRCGDDNRDQDKCTDFGSSATHSKVELMNDMPR